MLIHDDLKLFLLVHAHPLHQVTLCKTLEEATAYGLAGCSFYQALFDNRLTELACPMQTWLAAAKDHLMVIEIPALVRRDQMLHRVFQCLGWLSFFQCKWGQLGHLCALFKGGSRLPHRVGLLLAERVRSLQAQKLSRWLLPIYACNVGFLAVITFLEDLEVYGWCLHLILSQKTLNTHICLYKVFRYRRLVKNLPR